MEAIRKIIEKKNNTLTIDIPSSVTSTKFEVIVLPIAVEDDNVKEEWGTYVYQNKSLEFLNESDEDIYTINDGKPYEHKK